MKIEFRDPQGQFVFYEVKVGTVTVGRSRKCDITIEHDSISREHLRIMILEGDDATVTDLGSSNGTYLNESRLDPNMPEAFSPLFSFIIGNGIHMRMMEASEEFPEGAEVHQVKKVKESPISSVHVQTEKSMHAYTRSATRKTNFHPKAEKAARKNVGKNAKDKKEGMNPVRIALIILAAVAVYLVLTDGM